MFENDDILRFIKDQIPIPAQTKPTPLFNLLEKAGQ